ncbi:MAG: GNAT family N-acetyltransferase [Microgenomates group bacterium]
MRHSISIKETPLDEAVLARQTSQEFGETYKKEDFEKRYKGKDPLIIAAYMDEGSKPVGYLIGFDRFKDGSFYCWLSGVWGEHRKRRIFHALMMHAQHWARKKGYKSVKIKTRNKRTNILQYLIKSEYHFLEVTPDPNPAESRILLEKKI